MRVGEGALRYPSSGWYSRICHPQCSQVDNELVLPQCSQVDNELVLPLVMECRFGDSTVDNGARKMQARVAEVENKGYAEQG